MSTQEHMIIILMASIGTILTRFLPFILFPENKPVPKYVDYLGKVLPSAALGLLMIYGLKDTNFLSGTYGIPEVVASIVVIGVHLLKRQILLSIASGTIIYMLLVQFVFV